MNIKITLDKSRIMNKTQNEKFGLFVANEWKKLINPYTPRDTGNLMRNVELMPFKIHYKVPYAHYMYTGKIYVDPEYKVGGFYSSTYGWYSRPGVTKIPSGRSFNYSKSKNPSATDHWDVVAAQSGQLDKLYRTVNNAINSGRF